jgi:hypothetical protein
VAEWTTGRVYRASKVEPDADRTACGWDNGGGMVVVATGEKGEYLDRTCVGPGRTSWLDQALHTYRDGK